MSETDSPSARAPRESAGRRLVVALDVATVRAAEALAEGLGELDPVFKIGHQLAYTGGLGLAERLVRAGRRVFLDLKLHDIPRTVEEGVRALSGFGASFLTVHAYPQTMAAAVEGRGVGGLRLLAVTILTSMDDRDAAAAGFDRPVAELVRSRAETAAALGVDGLVCAAPEVAQLRVALGPDLLLVVPGIRPSGGTAGDQKRVVTPGEAMRLGADLIVVGRPITGASDPLAAARAIVAEMESGLAG